MHFLAVNSSVDSCGGLEVMHKKQYCCVLLHGFSYGGMYFCAHNFGWLFQPELPMTAKLVNIKPFSRNLTPHTYDN